MTISGGALLAGSAQSQPAAKPVPDLERGRKLSLTLCASCHVYPEPNLHGVGTWRQQVQPLMPRNAGIAQSNPAGTAAGRTALEQWRLIWEYYFATAPATPLPQAPRPPIRRELKGFTVEDPKYRRGSSYATTVQLDPATRQIYVGNAVTRSLEVLDQSGRGLASTRLDTTLTQLVRDAEGGGLGTQIGRVVVDDRPLGRLTLALRPEWPRLDAGRGLWLRGKGEGGFTAVPGPESGVPVYGEQRGAAVGDFNEDGRVDLVEAQNAAATRRFENTGARPGLRVRRVGPPGNPMARNAVVRPGAADRLGPARELHAGSGYASQDSAVLVRAARTVPDQVFVRWPGGRQTFSSIPAEAREVAVHAEGRVQVLPRRTTP